MNYTHDPKKLAQNVAKHGLWFDIVFPLRETAVRIISLRKANRREVKEYENQA